MTSLLHVKSLKTVQEELNKSLDNMKEFGDNTKEISDNIEEMKNSTTNERTELTEATGEGNSQSVVDDTH